MSYPLYLLALIGLTLGLLYACGLLIWLCSRLFSRLVGRHAWVILDVTSIIGTPVHELGHALMCLPFLHRITKMRLWKPHLPNFRYPSFILKTPINFCRRWATSQRALQSVIPTEKR